MNSSTIQQRRHQFINAHLRVLGVFGLSVDIQDVFHAYSFLLQIRPDLIKEGRELLIPDEGVYPFLSELHAPTCIPTTKLKGRLRILRVEDTTLEAWLDVQGEDEVSDLGRSSPTPRGTISSERVAPTRCSRPGAPSRADFKSQKYTMCYD